MRLSATDRIQAEALRRVARALLGSPRLRERFGRSRSRALDGRTLEPELAAMLGLDDLTRESDLRRHAPAEARRRVARSVRIVDGDPPREIDVRDLAWPGPAGSLGARLYEPHGLGAPSPGLLYIHGGGFVTCDLDTHDVFCRTLAVRGRVRVVSIEYRLAPEHRFPAAKEDSVAAFRWLARAAPGLGMDPARLGVAGDSAGGNLAAVVALHTREDAIRPSLHVPIYPATDATCTQPSHAALGDRWFLTSGMIDWYFDQYAGHDPAHRRHPDCSPLWAADVRGLPPALVYTAGFDPLRDEGEAWASRLREAAVPVRRHCFDALIHGFAMMTGVSPGSRLAVERIAHEVGDALRNGVER
jgi:acetyl esterase